jgi:outer membrane protein assembly factor BamA
LLFPLSVYSQESGNQDTLKLSEVIIIGNKVTEKKIIIRELSFLDDSTFTKSILQEDAERLINLGIFDKVNIEAVPSDASGKVASVIVEVNEGPHIIPIPQGGIYDGKIERIWIGMDLRIKNFRGINEETGLSFGLGYQPFVELSFRDNWIGEKSHFFVFTNFGFHRFVNKEIPTENLNGVSKDSLQEYRSNRYNGAIGIGKYISRHAKISLAYGFYLNDIMDYLPGRSLTDDGNDKYSTITFDFNYDKRNDVNYSLQGTYFDVFYSKYGVFNRLDFNRVSIDFRKYIPIKIANEYFVTFAFRVYNLSTFGSSVPDYLRAYLGYDNYIRGFNEYLFKGDNIFLLKSEFRIPIIKPFLVSGKEHPIIKSLPVFKEFTYKYGLYGTVFYDVGGINSNSASYFNIPFKNGYGIGLNAVLPFNFIGRMDFVFRQGIPKFIERFSFDLNAAF